MHRMLDDYDRQPFRSKAADYVHEDLNFLTVQPSKRLVKEKQNGARRERPCELHKAQLVVRQLAGGNIPQLVKTDPLQHASGSLKRVVSGWRLHEGADQHVLEEAHARKGPHKLERPTNSERAYATGAQTDDASAIE